MRVQVGVDEVLEVGQAVLRGHVEEGVDILALPVEVGRDVVGRDREREDAAVRVAARHDLDERAVDEVHFPLQLTVGEVDDLVADEGVLVREVVRARPVEGQVRERALAAPARGHVQVVDELLHALHDVLVLHVVQAHEGGHVGVKRGEGLGARPLVLEGAEEVDDLAARRGEVLGRGRGDRAAHAVKTLLDQALEGPAGAVSGEHVEVVDVVVALAVGGANLGGVDVFEPVVGDDLARRVQDEAAQRIPLVRVGIHPPIGAVEVLLHGCDGVDVVSGCGHGPCPVLIPLCAAGCWALGGRCAWCRGTVWGDVRLSPYRRFGGRRAGTAVRSRDRHVVDALPSWGEAVALWVEVVSSARREVP